MASKVKEEIWRPVVGFEDLYEVSDEGRVKTLNYKNSKQVRIMKQHINNSGYFELCLFKDKKIHSMKVHRLVAMAFIPNPQNLATVNHKNEIKTDNRAENLEWMSDYDNQRHGTHDMRIGLKNRGKFVNRKDQSKVVLQFTIDGEFVAEYPSTKEAYRQTGFNFSNIGVCCVGKRLKTYKGYVWKYKEVM